MSRETKGAQVLEPTNQYPRYNLSYHTLAAIAEQFKESIHLAEFTKFLME